MAIHHHQLRVVEGRRCEPDTAAAFEHLPPHRARRPMHKRQIIFRGQDDVHTNAAQRGQIQCRGQRDVRQKIRRENSHGGLRFAHRREQRPSQFFEIRVRTVGDHPSDDVAALG